MCLLLEAVYTTPDVIFDTLVLQNVCIGNNWYSTRHQLVVFTDFDTWKFDTYIYYGSAIC